MSYKKVIKTDLHVMLNPEIYDWFTTTFGRETSITIENILIDLRNKNERSELIRRKLFMIPEHLRVQDGYVEYSPDKWCEEKAFWKIDFIIKKMEASKLFRDKKVKKE